MPTTSLGTVLPSSPVSGGGAEVCAGGAAEGVTAGVWRGLSGAGWRHENANDTASMNERTIVILDFIEVFISPLFDIN